MGDDLLRFQADVRHHVLSRWGDVDKVRAALKLAEEAGEVCGAVLDWERAALADIAEVEAHVLDEVGDATICLLLLAEQFGLDLIANARRRFEEVQARG